MHYVRRNDSGQHEPSQVAMHAAIITMTTKSAALPNSQDQLPPGTRAGSPLRL